MLSQLNGSKSKIKCLGNEKLLHSVAGDRPWSQVTDGILCSLTSGRYLDQTQPNVQDEGEEGRLCGRLPGRKGNCSRWSR